MRRPYQNIIFLLLAVACVSSRLPQLISDNLLLDGDECVTGIMAKHIMTRQAFSAYFYGQAYGFSLVECLFIIPFYFLSGITSCAVKLGMLTLWTSGVLFLYKAFLLISKGNKWVPLLFILVFIFSPAWAVWSMKARGGYLTSFTLSSVVLCLLFSDRKSNTLFFVTGILCFFIYQSQSLWLIGLIPLVAFVLFSNKKAVPFLFFIAPVLLLCVAAFFYKQAMLEFGTAETNFSFDRIPLRTQAIPVFLFNALHGNYYFNRVQHPNFICAFQAIVFETLVFALPLIAVYNLIKKKQDTTAFNITAISLLFTIAIPMFIFGFQGRYLLPVTAYTLVALLLLLNTTKTPTVILYPAACVYIAVGAISVTTFSGFSFMPFKEEKLKASINYLTGSGIHYAYSPDNMFTWQLIFYSNEQLICHEQRLPGRFPKYVWETDSAYYSGAKTALIVPPGSSVAKDGFMAIDPPKEVIAREFPRQTERPKYYYCRE